MAKSNHYILFLKSVIEYAVGIFVYLTDQLLPCSTLNYLIFVEMIDMYCIKNVVEYVKFFFNCEKLI